MVSDMGKIIERNNVIFDRIDKRLERIDDLPTLRQRDEEPEVKPAPVYCGYA
jgi:hypothetical protein